MLHGPVHPRITLLWAYHGTLFLSDSWIEEFEVQPGVFFVESGLIGLRHEGKETLCRPGDLFFTFTGHRSQFAAPGTRLLSIGYQLGLVDQPPLYDLPFGLHVPKSQRRAADHALQAASVALCRAVHPKLRHPSSIQSYPEEAPDLVHHAARQAALWKWLTVLMACLEKRKTTPRPFSIQDSTVGKVRTALDKRPLNKSASSISVDLALNVGWRRVQQLFRAELHMSPSQYFERRRLRHAQMRLSEVGVSVKEVASELGFSSLSHFSFWFKRHCGCAPRVFQTRL
ncbi:Helix-turn-helix domain-containing protein [Verrucomicrobium sp. GAS474]|uniref:helix-turn-helix transcriptional regulator n=1 Tax=Verrucomicrobium sp. GAS474 TaxID=1882831 RepID=UPI00087DC6A9|nr:helix-turn-helix transcriptional regulator [Verrucomicrobium sp. GAS474]SDU30507.1 Helix-turn-helix domain-containing protein [Verrucomicrobium sp. GAS474]